MRLGGWAPGSLTSEEVERAVKYIEKRGGTCAVFQDRQRSSRKWATVQSSLGKRLCKLPKPLGVMAANGAGFLDCAALPGFARPGG